MTTRKQSSEKPDKASVSRSEDWYQTLTKTAYPKERTGEGASRHADVVLTFKNEPIVT